jgi:hypothetical protein
MGQVREGPLRVLQRVPTRDERIARIEVEPQVFRLELAEGALEELPSVV